MIGDQRSQFISRDQTVSILVKELEGGQNLIIGLILQLLEQLDKLLAVILHHSITVSIRSSNQPGEEGQDEERGHKEIHTC